MVSSAELPRKLLEVFQQTPLGSFVARRRADERQELLQCYLRDFLLLTMRVSTGRELEVRAEAGQGGLAADGCVGWPPGGHGGGRGHARSPPRGPAARRVSGTW